MSQNGRFTIKASDHTTLCCNRPALKKTKMQNKSDAIYQTLCDYLSFAMSCLEFFTSLLLDPQDSLPFCLAANRSCSVSSFSLLRYSFPLSLSLILSFFVYPPSSLFSFAPSRLTFVSLAYLLCEHMMNPLAIFGYRATRSYNRVFLAHAIFNAWFSHPLFCGGAMG